MIRGLPIISSPAIRTALSCQLIAPATAAEAQPKANPEPNPTPTPAKPLPRLAIFLGGRPPSPPAHLSVHDREYTRFMMEPLMTEIEPADGR